jgi:hypothetical protein
MSDGLFLSLRRHKRNVRESALEVFPMLRDKPNAL